MSFIKCPKCYENCYDTDGNYCKNCGFTPNDNVVKKLRVTLISYIVLCFVFMFLSISSLWKYLDLDYRTPFDTIMVFVYLALGIFGLYINYMFYERYVVLPYMIALLVVLFNISAILHMNNKGVDISIWVLIVGTIVELILIAIHIYESRMYFYIKPVIQKKTIIVFSIILAVVISVALSSVLVVNIKKWKAHKLEQSPQGFRDMIEYDRTKIEEFTNLALKNLNQNFKVNDISCRVSDIDGDEYWNVGITVEDASGMNEVVWVRFYRADRERRVSDIIMQYSSLDDDHLVICKNAIVEALEIGLSGGTQAIEYLDKIAYEAERFSEYDEQHHIGHYRLPGCELLVRISVEKDSDDYWKAAYRISK